MPDFWPIPATATLSGTIGGIVPADIAKLLAQQVSRLAVQNSGAGKGPSLDYLVWLALVLWSAIAVRVSRMP